jgi:hypothetical protein
LINVDLLCITSIQYTSFFLNTADNNIMTKVLNVAFLLLLALGAIGCDKQVSDYVDGVRRTPKPGFGGGDEEDTMAFKISPGRLGTSTVGAGGVEGGITGTITPTRQFYNMGADMSMSISINKKRMIQN